MRWIALGSLAIMILHGTFAEECPLPVTVTKTETTTVWAGTYSSAIEFFPTSPQRCSLFYSPYLNDATRWKLAYLHCDTVRVSR